VHVKLFYRIVLYGGDELSWAGFYTPQETYRLFRTKSSQQISWLVQNTQPSQPITWLILTQLNISNYSQEQHKNLNNHASKQLPYAQTKAKLTKEWFRSLVWTYSAALGAVLSSKKL